MEISVLYEQTDPELEMLALEDFVAFVLGELSCPENTDVTITFVSDKRIHELNRDYRGIDRPTDVLSFECDNTPFEDEEIDIALLPEYELGDVIIAPDIARAQAREYQTTFAEEIQLLIVHGLLHLNGYDHIELDEALVMEGMEDTLLRAWKEHVS